MENFDELLKKYADFIVRVGVNPQPGQTLIINCPLEGAPLARLCVRSAYEAGARDVQVNWSDDAVARARRPFREGVAEGGGVAVSARTAVENDDVPFHGHSSLVDMKNLYRLL